MEAFAVDEPNFAIVAGVENRLHAVDQALDPFVLGAERVLAQDGALRLVVGIRCG